MLNSKLSYIVLFRNSTDRCCFFKIICYNNTHMDTFSKKDLIVKAFNIYKKHIFSLTVIYASVFIVMWGATQVTRELIISPEISNLYAFIFIAGNFFVQTMMGMWVVYLALKIDVNFIPKLSDFMREVNLYPRFIAVSFIVLVVFYLGLALFIVPGLFVLSAFVFSTYDVLDKPHSIFKSIAYSYKITKGHRINILLFVFLLVLLNLIGTITMIGLLLSVPVTSIAMAHLYHFLSCKYESINKDKCGISNAPLPFWQRLVVYVSMVALSLVAGYGYYKNLQKEAEYEYAQEEFMEVQQKMEKIRLAIQLYKDNHGVLPEILDSLVVDNILESLPQGYSYSRDIDNSSFTICSPDGACIKYASMHNDEVE